MNWAEDQKRRFATDEYHRLRRFTNKFNAFENAWQDDCRTKSYVLTAVCMTTGGTLGLFATLVPRWRETLTHTRAFLFGGISLGTIFIFLSTNYKRQYDEMKLLQIKKSELADTFYYVQNISHPDDPLLKQYPRDINAIEKRLYEKYLIEQKGRKELSETLRNTTEVKQIPQLSPITATLNTDERDGEAESFKERKKILSERIKNTR